MITDDMPKASKPAYAKIREDECIGCTKCIQACPYDVIIGAAKQMHTVIRQECTGCEQCVEPCPVDCIDIIDLPYADFDQSISLARYQAKQARDQQKQQEKAQRYQRQTQAKAVTENPNTARNAKQQAIHAAVARVKSKQQGQNRSWQYVAEND